MATLKQAIEIAQQEPDSDRANTLMSAIMSGKMDSTAQQEGIDLSGFKSHVATSQGSSLAGQTGASRGESMVSQVTGMAEKAVENAPNVPELTPEAQANVTSITDQVKLEKASPTVGMVKGMTDKAQEADIEVDKYTRPGGALKKGLDSTVGQIPVIGDALSYGLGMAAKPITLPLDATVATYEAGEEAFGTVQDAGTQAGEALFGIDVETGGDLTASQRIVKGGGALADLLGGGMGVAFAPITGIIDELPDTIEKGVEYPFEKLNEASQFTSKNFQETLGIQEGSEQAQVMDKLFGVLGQTLALKAMQDISKSKAPEYAKGKAQDFATKAGEVAGKAKETLVKTKEAVTPKVGEAATGVAETASILGTKVVEKASEAFEGTRVAKKAKMETQANDVVGQIVQGKKTDIGKAKKALQELDTAGVKTYEQLSEVAGDKISVLSETLDKVLTEKGGSMKLADLEVTTKVGNKTVSQNFVKDSLNHLEELYKKTNDKVGEAKIQNIREKANSEGLSFKEINDIAKEYGSNFKQKAFNKQGDPLTSVNAQKFENTRKGVKDTFREKIEGDAPKMLDQEMSQLYSLKNLTEKMSDKVQKLTQKVQKRGKMEKIARAMGTTVDFLTFGMLKSFVSKVFFPSNVGFKSLNSLHLEGLLKKNLKKLDKLSSLSEEQMVDQLVTMGGTTVA